jgi:2-haloacid dehalogenase
LINVREGSYGVFERVLREAGAAHIDVKVFWEAWEARNIKAYWSPYRTYKDICRQSLVTTFEEFWRQRAARHDLQLLDAFSSFELYSDVADTLSRLSHRFRLAIVSNIDDDLLAATPLKSSFDVVCTAERAKGYKSDGTLFRYLLANAGAARHEILHSGQSQFTDMVGAKPLGITVAWINHRRVALSPEVPQPDFQFPDIQSLLSLLMPEQ